MKKVALNLLGIFTVLIMFSGCGSVAISDTQLTVLNTSDFVPPTGRPANPPPESAGERRLLTATSLDGEHFTATGKILTDQGNVPDIILEEDGTILVYYVGQSIEEGKESTAVAISDDNGESWKFKNLVFEDWPQPRDPSDPDVILLDNGTYRMYYTSSIGKTNKIGILYADSPDGITFTYKGIALSGSENVIDSTTLYFDGLWHMYVLKERGEGQLHATSANGKTFTFTEDALVFPEEGYIASNALISENAVRMFAFGVPSFADIRSFTSSDMETWVAGDIALEGDEAATLGSEYIQDSSVVELADGTFLLVYVSEMSE